MSDTAKLSDGDKELTFFSIREVSSMFSVTQETVRNWIKAGDLPAIKVGNRIRIQRGDLVDFTKARYVAPGEETNE